MNLTPWREAHPLEGVIRKIWWAYKHLEVIDRDLDAYETLHPHSVITNLNAEETFHECRLRSVMPPPIEVGIRIGEFAYQLRSALDQIVFALSVFPPELTSRDLERAERSTSFPIMKIPNESYILGQLGRIPEDRRPRIWEIIDSLQPYQRGDGVERDLLAILDELNVRDKHRILKPTGVVVHINREHLAEGIEILADGSANTSDVIARVPAHLDPKTEFYPRVSVEEVIPIPRPAGGVYLAVLSDIYKRVRDGVLPPFLEFFPPLPPDLESVRIAL